jgi:hypothetical protein
LVGLLVACFEAVNQEMEIAVARYGSGIERLVVAVAAVGVGIDAR